MESYSNLLFAEEMYAIQPGGHPRPNLSTLSFHSTQYYSKTPLLGSCCLICSKKRPASFV